MCILHRVQQCVQVLLFLYFDIAHLVALQNYTITSKNATLLLVLFCVCIYSQTFVNCKQYHCFKYSNIPFALISWGISCFILIECAEIAFDL